MSERGDRTDSPLALLTLVIGDLAFSMTIFVVAVGQDIHQIQRALDAYGIVAPERDGDE